jgi:hypothetical protein
LRWALCVCLAAVAAGPASGQDCRCDLAAPNGPQPGENDGFGWSIGISGIDVVVGSTAGYVNLYLDAVVQLHWVQTLTPPDGGGGGFGRAVAIDGETLVVGAMFDSDAGPSAGAAYVFERTDQTWSFVTKLTASDAAEQYWFGESVALDGDTLVIRGGGMYVFARDHGGPDSWGEVTKLVPPRGWTGYVPVDVDGDTIVAWNDVYERNAGGPDNWGWTTEITIDEPGVYLGTSVSIDGDTVIIGSQYTGGYDGSAHIFERNLGGPNEWGLVASLSEPDPPWGLRFGYAVAIDGDLAVVGAPWGTDGGSNLGRLYAFRRDQGGPNNWGLVSRVIATETALGDHFGWAVGLDGGTAVAGGPGIDACFYCPGWAYAVNLDGCALTLTDCNENLIPDECEEDCNGNGVPDECDLADGTSEDLNQNGEPDECEAYVIGCEIERHASDAMAGDAYGTMVASEGDTAAVGAPLQDELAEGAGAVYILERDHGGGAEWGEAAKILSPDGAINDKFGTTVALGGGTLLVGAPFDDDHGPASGSAYVFRRDGSLWQFIAKLTAPDGLSNYEFGSFLDVDGNTAVVGNPYDTIPGTPGCGSVYVFQEIGGTWAFVTKLFATDAGSYDRLGTSVAVDGDRVLSGAPYAEAPGTHTGAAYVFHRNLGGPNQWGQAAKLTASGDWSSQRLGESVAIHGDVAVVGDPYGHGSLAGAVYVFQRTPGGQGSWIETAKLLAPDPEGGDNFGHAVSIGDVGIAVGTTRADGNGPGLPGVVYLFRRDPAWPLDWIVHAHFSPVDGAPDDHFGTSVAVTDSAVVAGAPEDADMAPGSGSAYVFDLHRCERCPADIAPPYGSVGAVDFLALLAAWGTDPGGPPDLDGNGTVGVEDFLLLLEAWGPCFP